MHKIFRNSIIFSLIVFVSCNNNKVKVSSSNNDSIEKYLQLASNDTIPFPERDKYNQKAFSFIDLSRNDTLTIDNLYLVSKNYCSIYKLEELKKVANILENKATLIKDTIRLVKAYKAYIYYYTWSSKNDSALNLCFKAKKIYIKKNREQDLCYLYRSICIIQYFENDFLGSINTSLKGLKIANKINDLEMMNFFNYEIGINLSDLKEYEKALEYFNKSSYIIKKLNNNVKLFYLVNNRLNIANTYIELKKYNRAIYFIKKILIDKKNLQYNPSGYARALDYFALIKLKSNDLIGIKDKLQESDSIRKFNNIENGKNYNKIYLSEYYATINDTSKAIKYANEAIQISKSFRNPNDVLQSIKQLLKVDKSSSQKFSQEYIRISDSLQLGERKFREKFARLEYETDEITQEKETAIKQKWVLASIISSVLLIVILLFVIHKQRAKQKELQLLQTQQKANEEIYQLMLNQQAKVEEARQIEKKRIALELHDGIMNRLASTRLNLFVLSKKNDPETINNCLTYIEDIHDIENEIRNVSHDLNQELFLEKDSFKMLLKQFVKEQNSHNTTHYELQIAENVNWELVSSQTKMHLYRIIQEASHNINKYAKATQACISFTMEENQLCLSIADNGIGFDTTKTKEGIGLQNMQQRSQELQGIFSIESNNNGTKLHFKIPMV